MDQEEPFQRLSMLGEPVQEFRKIGLSSTPFGKAKLAIYQLDL
jgi:hypothetical protein